ncbi:hypothetical protein B0F90DRAFT_1872703 [Multifurca ochricompacta]|uniref:G-patch domain-containing protein n=1 Tax=Multifurca ochricompacta TaxID=376703 RepID=A0AAD4M8Z8_9AGAM|nr:hypothetical protein B0F90DRAFT_1872703 [Multifurca ochricompacta]
MSSGTARLKRRLDEQGVNYTNKKAVENFCLIGTPLPPLEKKDANEFVPLWKQDVRDEKGRRRLHGAFTGGFSAGYFNTVGSKEGWTPSTFISSRSDRAKQKLSRPEDYMDEEDLAELRESQIMAGVKEQQERDAFGSTQSEPTQGDSEQDIQRALMPPLEDSAGVRLLKKMGWRPGQGVGPRVSWRTRKIQDLLAAGKSINGVDIDALDDDEEAKRHLYPPRDTVVPRVQMKSDAYGLGYTAASGLNEGLGQKRPESKGPRLAAGFGLGALNEAEDDDLDVYDLASRADRTYMPYDAVRDTDESAVVSRDKSNQKVTAMTQQRFLNGISLLPGFVLSGDPVQKEQWFPMPEIPSGWKPDPRRVWQKDPNADAATTSASTQADAFGRRKLTPDQRGAILGETPLPSTRSVFDYLSKEDRERIEHAAAGLPPPTSDSTPTPAEARPAPSSIPYIAPHIASAALKGFMPFTNDPPKQARYVAFLRSQSTPDHPELLPPQLSDQSSNAYHKELSDYAKSAAIFKPVSGAMASRFTTAAAVESDPKVKEGLHQPVHEPEPTPQPLQEEREREKELQRREDEPQSSKAHAARTGMFGALTREVVPWQPSRLLCKRFGVKDPNPDITTDAPMPGASKNDSRIAEEALAEANLQTTAGSADPGPSSTGRRTAHDLENIGLGEDDSQGRDTLTYVRPSMDIFKAIFASDDEDSDDGEPEGGGSREPSMENVDAGAVPAHLRMDDAVGTSLTYEPRSADAERGQPSGNSGTGVVVDVTTFKPVFVPRGGERQMQKAAAKDQKEGRRGKEKKKIVKAIVSFEDDEGAGLVISPQTGNEDKNKNKDKDKDKEKTRKKRKRRKEGDVEDVEMWVEKVPPQVVTSFADAPPPTVEPIQFEGPIPPPPTSSTQGQVIEGPARGRKRAIDFL